MSQSVGSPKLQESSTGAWLMRRIRFRRRAALWRGKTRGPNVSRKVDSESAGWWEDNVWPGGASAEALEMARLRVRGWPLGDDLARRRMSFNADGDPSPEVGVMSPSSSRCWYSCQNSSRGLTLRGSSTRFLDHHLSVGSLHMSRILYSASVRSLSACLQLLPSLP